MMSPKPLMQGKKGLIMGVANERSIAWGIASAASAQGAELAFTYQGEALLKRITPLAEEVGSNIILECDVTDMASLDRTFDTLKEKWHEIDFVVHAIAYSDKEELKGKYVDTSRENFTRTMDISCYSFTAVCQRAVPMMKKGGSLITLTYYLAEDFGVLGIRVNALSAGPMKTLAASGIGDFRYILKWNEYNSPLRRNVTLGDVGGAGVYLLSDLSSGVTGEVHHVDCGYSTVGMKAVDAPDISTV
jgi:enoyl-[acyl-carrier protein] reductase I